MNFYKSDPKQNFSVKIFIIFSITLCLHMLNSGGALLASELPDSPHKDLSRVMGVTAADCKKCHPSEVARWMKTVHYNSADLRLYKFEGNTKKYADALGIKSGDLLKNSVCANCHATKAIREGNVKVISGVSCESCHGPSGGKGGWLNVHQSYNATMPVPRTEETPEHRAERFKKIDAAGMIRANNIYGMAKACNGCHMIDNEKLVAAGHKSASAFDFVSWAEGEVRHNYFMNKNVNAQAPSLWMTRTGGTAVNRKRVMYVVGALVQLERALRIRAAMTNPVLIPQIGGTIAAANGKLGSIDTPETKAAAAVVAPLFGTLFAPTPDDKKIYSDAADKVAVQAKKFSNTNDGSKLQALDPMIKAIPPHYSQQYQKKYQDK